LPLSAFPSLIFHFHWQLATTDMCGRWVFGSAVAAAASSAAVDELLPSC